MSCTSLRPSLARPPTILESFATNTEKIMSTLARVLTGAIILGTATLPVAAQSVAARQSLTLDGARHVIAAATPMLACCT